MSSHPRKNGLGSVWRAVHASSGRLPRPVSLEISLNPIRVRAAYVSDSDIRAMAMEVTA